MIRPLYRWKSIWLGVLVIVFLGWAWMRSISHTEGWEYFTALTGPGVLAQRSGTMVFVWNDPTAGGDPVRFSSHEMTPEDGPLPPAFELDRWDMQPGRGETIRCTIAHWFLILLFLVPWTGWLIGRYRAMSRSQIADAAL
jgi:hypothetical protein